MTNIDRNYVLSLLAEAKGTEDNRVRFYQTQPYPAMTIIAAERAYTLQLLIEDLQGGRLEWLHGKNEQAESDDAVAFARIAERDFEAVRAAEHGMTNADEDEELGYSAAQLDGTACVRCGEEFRNGEATVPIGYVAGEGQLFAHGECVGDDGGPTIHDVMSAEELYEADRDAEFAQDATDEERWATEAEAAAERYANNENNGGDD